MKKSISLLLGAILFLFSCKKNNESKISLLSEKIQYDVEIINNEPDAEWWIQNIEGAKREKFINLVVNAAKNQTIQIYNNNYNPTTFKKVISDFFSYDTINFNNKNN